MHAKVLHWLAIDPRNAEALIVVCGHYEVEIGAAAFNMFGSNHGHCKGGYQQHLSRNRPTGKDLRSAIHECLRMGQPGGRN